MSTPSPVKEPSKSAARLSASMSWAKNHEKSSSLVIIIYLFVDKVCVQRGKEVMVGRTRMGEVGLVVLLLLLLPCSAVWPPLLTTSSSLLLLLLLLPLLLLLLLPAPGTTLAAPSMQPFPSFPLPRDNQIGKLLSWRRGQERIQVEVEKNLPENPANPLSRDTWARWWCWINSHITPEIT